MSNARNTPVLSPGDYLKIKAMKSHLDDTGIEKTPLPYQTLSLPLFFRRYPCPFLP